MQNAIRITASRCVHERAASDAAGQPMFLFTIALITQEKGGDTHTLLLLHNTSSSTTSASSAGQDFY